MMKFSFAWLLKIAAICLVLSGLLTTGCRAGRDESVTAVANRATTEPLATATPTPTITPTLTTTPSPTATATATPTSTPIPTATAKPVAILDVPEKWIEAAVAALAEVELSDPNWQWQLATHADLATQLVAQRRHLALVPDGDGLPVGQRPLALAVPFITDWERTTAADAAAILRNGHVLITVMEWADMPPTHKALRVDGRLPFEAGYPLQQEWSLHVAPGYETAAAALAPILQSHLEEDTLVHLAAVGDIMLDRSLGYNLVRGNLLYPFMHVVDALTAADITVGNLECALGDIGEPVSKSYPFRAPPEAAQSLALAGFDVISLANNHGMDYGPDALLQGIGLLQEQGIGVVGAGENATAAHAPNIQEVNGIRLAFLGYVHVPVEWRGFDSETWTATVDTPGLAWGDPELIQADVTAARQQADLVIVILHSGFEYVVQPSPPQVAAARAAIDAGAALVIGHHAHILQGIEFYHDGVIAYGLGNFAFEIDGDPETMILHAWMDKSGVRQLEIVPAVIQFGGQPRLANEWEAGNIRRQVYHLTRLLNPR